MVRAAEACHSGRMAARAFVTRRAAVYRRLKGLLAVAVCLLAALASSAAPARAEFAAIGADDAETVVGPTFAGHEVVWGELGECRVGCRLEPSVTGPEFSVLAAVPGSHGSTLFSKELRSSDQEIRPLGLVASPTRIAFAYEVEFNCGESESLACSPGFTPEYVDTFGGATRGPFRRLARNTLTTDSVENAGVGLSGDDVVLAEPTGKSAGGETAYVQDLATGAPARKVGALGTLGLSVAGSYIASSTSGGISVTTLAGTPVYSVGGGGAGSSCTADSGGVMRTAYHCDYALDPDGTLAIAFPAGAGYALYWASPQQPELHHLAVLAASPLVAIADDEIVYLSPVGAGGAQLALSDLNGNARPISFPVEGGASHVSGLAFDGVNVAWADRCIYSGSVPATAPTGPPSPACAFVGIRSVSGTVATDGRIAITLDCRYAPCTGTLAVTAQVSETTGKGSRRHTKRKTVTIGIADFTGLAVGQRDGVSLKLDAVGQRLLRRSGHISVEVIAKLPVGSTSQIASEAVSLRVTRRGGQ